MMQDAWCKMHEGRSSSATGTFLASLLHSRSIETWCDVGCIPPYVCSVIYSPSLAINANFIMHYSLGLSSYAWVLQYFVRSRQPTMHDARCKMQDLQCHTRHLILYSLLHSQIIIVNKYRKSNATDMMHGTTSLMHDALQWQDRRREEKHSKVATNEVHMIGP
jgi:hypothetical protein